MTIALIDNRYMTILNARYALKKIPTDVLSFRLADKGRDSRHGKRDGSSLSFEEELQALQNAPYIDPVTGNLISPQGHNQHLIPRVPRDLGTIFLSVEYCHRIAKKKGMLGQDYLLLATVHGLTHLVGHVHKAEASYAQMKRAEEGVMDVLRNELISDENSALTNCVGESTGKRYIPRSYLD